MTEYASVVLLVIVMLDLYALATSRLGACIRASAIQGLALAVLPFVIAVPSTSNHLVHLVLIGVGTLTLKGLIIPAVLLRTLHKTGIRREVEPFVSQHLSLVLGAMLVGLAFWASVHLSLPDSNASQLLVPVALSTILIGFLIIVSRRKAITQVIGYLMMENGVFVFGLSLANAMPFAVEVGILLDVLVGVFVFGIVIHHISAEFDHIDTNVLSELRD